MHKSILLCNVTFNPKVKNKGLHALSSIRKRHTFHTCSLKDAHVNMMQCTTSIIHTQHTHHANFHQRSTNDLSNQHTLTTKRLRLFPRQQIECKFLGISTEWQQQITRKPNIYTPFTLPDQHTLAAVLSYPASPNL